MVGAVTEGRWVVIPGVAYGRSWRGGPNKLESLERSSERIGSLGGDPGCVFIRVGFSNKDFNPSSDLAADSVFRLRVRGGVASSRNDVDVSIVGSGSSKESNECLEDASPEAVGSGNAYTS